METAHNIIIYISVMHKIVTFMSLAWPAWPWEIPLFTSYIYMHGLTI